MRPGVVYAIGHKDGTVVYVGRTEGTAVSRFKNHKCVKTPVGDWIRQNIDTATIWPLQMYSDNRDGRLFERH